MPGADGARIRSSWRFRAPVMEAAFGGRDARLHVDEYRGDRSGACFAIQNHDGRRDRLDGAVAVPAAAFFIRDLRWTSGPPGARLARPASAFITSGSAYGDLGESSWRIRHGNCRAGNLRRM